MQALKQTIHNRDRCAFIPIPDRLWWIHSHATRGGFVRTSLSLVRAWQLLGVLVSFLPASPQLRRVLLNYIAAHTSSKVPIRRGDEALGHTRADALPCRARSG